MIRCRGEGHSSRIRARKAGRLLAVLAAVGLLCLSACGRIPTDGQVFHYAEESQSTPSASPAFNPPGPREGDSPEEILRGFIQAGTGVEDDYAIARQFLTQDFAPKWSPEEQTWVYQDDISVDQQGSESELTAQIHVATHIDERGIATSYDNPDRQKVTASFEQVDGQWRISEIPNGTIVSRGEFEQLFRSFSLYFYDPTYTYAVPDVRWFVNRPTVATSLVRVMMQGPAPYLKDAVVSAIPGGTSLQRSSVPINGDVAQVGLTGEAISTADQLTLERVHTQLQQSLDGISSISDASVSVDDKKIEVNQLENYRAPTVDPQIPDQQVGIREDSLVTYADGQTRTVSDLEEPRSAPVYPAMDADRNVYAYLNEDRQHLGVRNTSGRSVEADLPSTLTKPSVDFRQWVWVGTTGGQLYAVNGARGSDRPREVSAPWLEDQEISSFEVSRDGSRALVVTGQGESARLWVAGITRDDDGAPIRLSDPLRVGTTIHPTQAQWVSETSMVVVDTSGEAVEIVNLAGENEPVNGLSGIRSVSAGNGRENIYAQTAGDTFQLDRSSWTRINTDVTYLSYAG